MAETGRSITFPDWRPHDGAGRGLPDTCRFREKRVSISGILFLSRRRERVTISRKDPETGKNKKPLWREGAFERVDAIGKECVFESMAFQLRLND